MKMDEKRKKEGNETYCVQWNNHHSTVFSSMNALLEKNMLLDVTLAAQGQCIDIHRLVLCACSQYFEDLLSTHKEKHPIIFLHTVEFSVVEALVKYMYNGEVNLKQKQLSNFLLVAKALQIKGLSDDESITPNRDSSSPSLSEISPLLHAALCYTSNSSTPIFTGEVDFNKVSDTSTSSVQAPRGLNELVSKCRLSASTGYDTLVPSIPWNCIGNSVNQLPAPSTTVFNDRLESDWLLSRDNATTSRSQVAKEQPKDTKMTVSDEDNFVSVPMDTALDYEGEERFCLPADIWIRQDITEKENISHSRQRATKEPKTEVVDTLEPEQALLDVLVATATTLQPFSPYVFQQPRPNHHADKKAMFDSLLMDVLDNGKTNKKRSRGVNRGHLRKNPSKKETVVLTCVHCSEHFHNRSQFKKHFTKCPKYK